MEKIDSIRVFQVNGMPGATFANGGGGNGDGASLPEQVVNSALRYQVAKPLVDAIMKDAGLANGNLTGITQALSHMVSPEQSLVSESEAVARKAD